VEAYLAISNQLARFARALDHRDWAAVPGIFAADISFEYGEGEQSGLPALLAQFRKYLDVCGPTQHLLGSIQLHQAGARMVSQAYVQARHQGAGDKAQLFFDSNGDYIDQWEQRDGTWLIIRRDVRWHMHMGDPAVLSFTPPE
jgi:3-phenylpropionate/cinnamic acid dioxygenase small subunit